MTRPVAWWHPVCGLATALLVAAVLFTSFGANPRGLARRGDDLFPVAQPRGRGIASHSSLVFLFSSLGLVAGGRWPSLVRRTHPAVGGDWLGVRAAGVQSPHSLGQSCGGSLAGLLHCCTRWRVHCHPLQDSVVLLQFLIGLILLAGFGASRLLAVTPTVVLKGVLAVALLIAAGQLGWQARRAAFLLPADPRNPYVYAHTAADIERLARDLEQLIAAAPDGRETTR
jgi:hypothetical protein